ncbi:MAG: methylated-DNA--[protein]-cysteine S-methyltransferase [Beijerinckiaceae bacterium]
MNQRENPSIHLYETALGWCGVIWRDEKIIGAQLPLADRDATLRRIMQRFPDAVEQAPPAWITDIAAGVVALLDGERRDFSAAPLALDDVPAFNCAVYDIVKDIPPGETLTYGAIAKMIGCIEDSRRVGQAMGDNPFPPLIPCHRVVAANGKIGGFSAFGGIETKMKLLSVEQANFGHDGGLFGALPLAVKPR